MGYLVSKQIVSRALYIAYISLIGIHRKKLVEKEMQEEGKAVYLFAVAFVEGGGVVRTVLLARALQR